MEERSASVPTHPPPDPYTPQYGGIPGTMVVFFPPKNWLGQNRKCNAMGSRLACLRVCGGRGGAGVAAEMLRVNRKQPENSNNGYLLSALL